MNFDIDNLRIVLELCQSSFKRVLTWWSRSGEQSLVDPTHENRVGTSFCESKGRFGEEVSTGCMGSVSWSMLVIVRTSRLGRRDG